MKENRITEELGNAFRVISLRPRRASRSNMPMVLSSLALLVGGLTYILAAGGITPLPGSEEKIILGKNYLDKIEITSAVGLQYRSRSGQGQ